MRSLFNLHSFSGFGPTRIHPAEFAPITFQVRGKSEQKLRKAIQKKCHKLSGVYGMLDAQGVLIYVGKAKQLRNRLMSYFRVNSRDAKAGRILQYTKSIVWESTPNEFSALIRELELIRRFRPRFNVIGIPDRRRYAYICLGRSPAAYVYITREPTGKEVAVFGPLRGRAVAEEAVRRLNDIFRLRDCSQRQLMHFSDQGELFETDRVAGCLRFEISTCSGPCVGGCSRRQYGSQVRSVRAFLDGSNVEILHELEKQMKVASQALEFEKALAIREKWNALNWLVERLTWLRDAREEHSFIYPLVSSDSRTIWYLIHRGKVQGALYEPTDALSRKYAKEVIQQVFRQLPEVGSSLPHNQVDTVLLVSGWFRKHPLERDQLFSHSEAIKRCKG